MARNILFGFVVVTVALVYIQAEEESNIENIEKKCQEETGFHGNFSALTDEDIDKAKCYLRCLLRSVGLMSEDGKINKDLEKTVAEVNYKNNTAERDNQIKIIEECTSKMETEVKETQDIKEQCEIAFTYYKCKMEKLEGGEKSEK